MGRCVAALLGANVILTDMNDRLRLLQKNVDENALSKIGSAQVLELNWGDTLDDEFIDPLPDFGKCLASYQKNLHLSFYRRLCKLAISGWKM
jgi:hypothetical protein